MNIEEKYLLWLNHPQMDTDLKEELESMYEKQKEDAFYVDAQFGTAGMRNILGAGTNRLNVYTIRKATLGLAKVLVSENKYNGVAIAYDNRYKSVEFARESAKILASYGIKSYVYDSLRTTPQLSYTVRHLHCDAGIMITASHNSKEYNGYKIYDENGCQLVPNKVSKVIDAINNVEQYFVESPSLTKEQEELIHTIGQEVDDAYIKEVLAIQINPDIPKDNFKIVYTPQHGTSYKSIKKLFDTVGYDVVYVQEQCNPDPAFSNTLSPNPEDPRAYKLALEYAEKCDSDIVLTTDPDGDRLGLAVKHDGKYVLLSGNQTGAILIDYIFSQRQSKHTLPENSVMFNTVVTSDMGEKIADKYGVEVEKTLTGFKYIGDKIEQHNLNKDKKFVFGYEESYGYLLADFVRDKDANQSCLLIAECANYYKKKSMTMVDALNKLFEEVGTYRDSQKSLTLAGADGKEKMNQLIAKLRNNVYSEIIGLKVVKYQDFGLQYTLENGQKSPLEGYDKSDVLKYFLEDGSWLAIRPSGTEPKFKFYLCIKGSDMADAVEKEKQMNQFIDSLV